MLKCYFLVMLLYLYKNDYKKKNLFVHKYHIVCYCLPILTIIYSFIHLCFYVLYTADVLQILGASQKPKPSPARPYRTSQQQQQQNGVEPAGLPGTVVEAEQPAECSAPPPRSQSNVRSTATATTTGQHNTKIMNSDMAATKIQSVFRGHRDRRTARPTAESTNSDSTTAAVDHTEAQLNQQEGSERVTVASTAVAVQS